MAFRRKRRPSVAWLPIDVQESSQTICFLTGSNNIPATPNTLNTVIHTLTVDYPAEAIRAAAPTQLQTMADFEESGYRLRRIVGKCFVGVLQESDEAPTEPPISCLFGAGFMVLKVNPADGSPLLIANPNNYSPLSLSNVRDPWIWRRTWLLTNLLQAGQNATVSGYAQAPTFNGDYGSVQDGPHIDQKTARRISSEERLFFIASACNIGDASGVVGTVQWLLDYRLLASPLRVMGNRRNASR